MGICVGMQILADSSEEGNCKGLGYIKGKVKKINPNLILQKPKLPHLGWNSIEVLKNNELIKDIDPVFGFYFLHTYYFECEDQNNILATTNYGATFASAVYRENIFGIQFHPEKSHHNGVKLLHNFANL